MNVRFWGGWFLVIMGISIVLMMGCEKGALGVKSATVMGRIIDKDSPGVSVVNATVRMMSNEAVSEGTLSQGYTYATTVTDTEGKFVFENVNPDNVVFEIEANGYAKMQYPQVTADASDTTGITSVVQEVYIKSGSITQLGNLTMQKISNPLPEFVNVTSIILRDSSSLELLPDNTLVTINFNSQTMTLTALQWRQGRDTSGNPIKLQSESSFNVTAIADATLYRSYTGTLSGSSNIQSEISLEPVTYNLVLRCTNVPDYIEGGVVNIYAETLDTPAKVLATHTISNLGDLSDPNLPEVINLPGLALPVNLRVQIRGYADEIMRISSTYLPAGSQGNYRVDIDFLSNNSVTSFEYDPNDPPKSKVGMFDNIIRRDVTLLVSGPNLTSGDSIPLAAISLPYGVPGDNTVTYSDGNVFTADPHFVNVNNRMEVNFPQVAVGYRMNWSVLVNRVSSSTYNISSTTDYPNGVMINVPTTWINNVVGSASGILISANALAVAP